MNDGGDLYAGGNIQPIDGVEINGVAKWGGAQFIDDASRWRYNVFKPGGGRVTLLATSRLASRWLFSIRHLEPFS